MLSPTFFKRFVLPDIIATADSLEHAIYHLDGVGQLPFLDDLLAVDGIDGIQWVPGAGKELACSEAWMPVYKKIQAANKSTIIYVFENPEPLTHFYEVLDNKLLFPIIIFMDFYKSQF